jgi:hypothetical protein
MRPIVEPVMGGLAARLGVTVGQAYTICTGLVAALMLGGIGIPPVLRGVPEVLAAPVAPAVEEVPGDPAVGGEVGPIAMPPIGAPLAAATVPFHPAEGMGPGTVPSSPTGAQPDSPTAATAGTTRVLASVPSPGAPEGVAIAGDGTVYVATNNAGGRGGSGGSAIFAFRSDGSAIGSWLIADQPAGRANGLTGIAVDVQGAVWALDAATSRVLRLDPATSTVAVVATIPDVGPCVLPGAASCEPGVLDNRPELRGIAFAAGRALVTDRAQGLIWTVLPGGAVTRFATIDDRSPAEGPWGVTVTASGAVVVTVSGLVAVPPGQAAVVSIAVDADGAAGARTVLASFAAADRPTGVVAGAGGALYVALAGANHVVAIGSDGAQRHYDGGGVSPAFDAPTGLALRGGSLLVSNQSTTTNDPARWVLFDMAVDDRPISR